MINKQNFEKERIIRDLKKEEKISFNKSFKEFLYCKFFGYYQNYNNLKGNLIKFLSEANYNIYNPYITLSDKSFKELLNKFNEVQYLSYEDIEEIGSILYKEKEKRIKNCNITLIGHIIILLWKSDYLVISKIAPKIKKGLVYIKNKCLQIQQIKSKRKSLKNYKCLSKRNLLHLFDEYDKYIQKANDENRYENNWYPVCISEFYDWEYQEIIKEKSILYILKTMILSILK